ncbi:MAG: malectin domain-containing carbohydrate-binding protein, partial [Pseudomonadota bacterium]
MPDFGLDILRTGYNKPTSLQFVTADDGTVYLITSQQDGTLTVSSVTFTDTADGRTYDETIVFETEIINTILNHNDDGSPSGTNGRQVTGFHAGVDENGDIELYVTSSDPRIGGGGEANVDDKNLDTNSGVVSKVTINIPGTQNNDGDWSASKIDLVRGIPRSEENHSINGVDFTPDGNLLVMVGGFANAGAPSQNLVYTPEYFLSGSLLEIDVSAIEALPTLTDSEGQEYKYNLPTLGIQRGEAGDDRPGAGFSSLDGMPWGGNDGYNQAYLEAGGPVDIFATGFRNGYDVDVVELEPGDIGYSNEPGADNFRVYVWDNGANNGWGEAPANAQGQVFATNPSGGNLAIYDNNQWKDVVVQEDGEVFVDVEGVTGVFVNTGGDPEFLAAERPDNIPLDENNNPISPGAQDGLHFVERGSYYGSPNLFHANPDAVLYLKPELEGGGEDDEAIIAPEFTSMSVRDYLPPELNGDPLNGFEPSPLSGFYLKPTKGGAPFDPSLVLNNGSTNGIVVFEYIEGVHPADMEIYDGDLFAVGFDEQILHVDLSEDGRTALNRTEIENNNAFQSSPGANPLDITIAPDGSIWVAAHGAGNIFAFVSGGEPVQETQNDDNDQLFDAFDPFQLDDQNGLGTNSKVDPGEVFEFTMENEIGAPNGLDGFVLGLTGHMVNYTTEYFTNSSGVIAGGVLDGGIAGKLQIEFDAVGDGSAEGSTNDLTYALQAGINYEDSSKRVLLESALSNVWTGTTPEAGQSQGIYFGTGTQFDFASFSFEINDQGDEVVRVYIELNDQQAFVQEFDATGMTEVDDEDLIMRVVIDREALTVQALWQYETNAGTVTGQSDAISLSQFGNNNLTEAIIGAGQGGFLAREAPEGGVRGDPIFSNLQTDVFVNMGLAVGVTGRVDLTNEEGGELFTPEFDNLLITASDAQGDFAADARDEIAGDVEFGQTLIVDVSALLANDRSFEGGTLSITAVQAEGGGTAELINGGTQVAYTPASPSETGFTYTVADSANDALATAKADVNITVPDIGGTVVYRLNAGSGTVAAVDDGPDWIGDTTTEGSAFITSSEPGGTFSNGLTNAEDEMDLTNLPNAADIPWQLFVHERSDPPGNPAALEYTFAVDAGATYAVTVYYVENWQNIFTSPAQRVFDISVNGEVPPEFQGIHPLAEAADYLGVPIPSGTLTNPEKQPFLGTAFSRTVVVTADSAELDLSFVTGTQSPKVNAIEIRELVPADATGPSVSISDGTATEGDAVIFTLDLSDTADEVVTVTYEIVPDTAQPGVDYDIGSATPDENGIVTGMTTIAATAADGSIVINTIDNEDFFGDRGFTVNITNVSGADAVIGTPSASGTIVEDDANPNGQIFYAINAGGSSPVDGALYGLPGVTFETDTSGSNHPTLDLANATSGGGGTGNNTNNNGAGLSYVNPDGTPFTGDTTLFESERWTNDFGYNLPIANGTYLVDLYFAETFISVQGSGTGQGIGGRKFDVSIEGQQVEDDLDLYDEGDGVAGNDAGQALVPIIKTYVVTVSDGVLDIDLNSLVSNGGADNAKISALVVREAIDVTPEPAILSVVAPADTQETDDATTTSLVFDFVFDKTPEESVEITYSVSIGGVETQTDIPLILGTANGQVTVDVSNDDEDNGPETVVVSITSISTASATAEISPTNGSGTASVTEDDGPVGPPADDIDEDGILNIDDPFAYDGTNGDANVLAAGGEITQTFDTDSQDPFSAETGFTGILVNPAFDPPGASAADPYGDRTTDGNGATSGGFLNVTSSNEDSFGPTGAAQNPIAANNIIKDNYQSAVDVTGTDTFEIVANAKNPWFGGPAPGAFAALGITVGAGGVDDWVKLVFGGSNQGTRIELADQNSLNGNNNQITVASQISDLDVSTIADIQFSIFVDKTAGDNGQLSGFVTFFASDGTNLGTMSTPVRDINPSGSLAASIDGLNPLTGGDGGLAYGISITDYNGGADPQSTPSFTAEFDDLTIRSLDSVGGSDALVSITGRAPVVEQGDVDTTSLIFDITADNGASGDVEISYTVDTGDGPAAVTETVSLVEGAGTITVSVENDDIDDDDDLATVTLTDVTTIGYAVDGENASASNTVTEDEFNTPYSEETDGDLSDDNLAPTDIKIALGDNLITAAQQGTVDPDDRDFFTISIADGQVLDAIVLDSVALNDTAGFIGFMAGDTFAADIDALETDPSINPADVGVLGGYLYEAGDQGTDILQDMVGIGLGFQLPLPSGTYTFWLNQNGPSSEATLNFQISEVSTIEISDAPEIVEGGDDVLANDTLLFPVTAVPAREGDVTLNVTIDINGTQVTEDRVVTLDASGEGTLSVDIAQDDEDDGSESVSVTLNSVSGTAFELGTTTAATGLVTEDDTVDTSDLDMDGVVNAIDPAYLDPTNGLSNTLEAGQTIGVEFNEDGPIDPLSEGTGVSGVAVNPDETGTGDDVDPYLGLTTGTGVIENGLLTVTTTNGDSFNANNASANNYGFMLNTSQTDEFTVTSRIVQPEGGIPAVKFAAFGIQIGEGTQESYIKVARASNNQGDPIIDVRWDNNDSQQDANPTGGNSQAIALNTEQAAAESYIISIDVDRTDPANITVTPRIQPLDANQDPIGAEILAQTITVDGDIADAINGLNSALGSAGGGLFVGAYSTDFNDATAFQASWDYIRVTSNDALPDTTPPVAVFSPVATLEDNTADIVVEVMITDDVALNNASVEQGDVTLTGPGVTGLAAGAFAFDPETGIATYTFSPPTGTWEEGA